MRKDFSLYAEINCKTAAEFMDVISPHRPPPQPSGEGKSWEQECGLWERGDREGWLFRGQGEAVWPLIPSAHRSNAFQPFIAGQLVMPPYTAKEILDMEESVAHQFASRASELGHEVGWERPEMRDYEKLQPKQDGCDFPRKPYRALYGLAQHYGVPTRLLDWTRSPLIGAYFALEAGAGRQFYKGREIDKRLDVCSRVFRDRHYAPATEPKSDDHCALWALNGGFLKHYCWQSSPGAVLITVPGSSNPNLRTQGGVFTLVRYRPKHKGNALKQLPPTLDSIFKNDRSLLRRGVHAKHMVPRPKLYKITLPFTEAPRALYWLHLLGIDASTVYERREAIVDSLKERWIRSKGGREK